MMEKDMTANSSSEQKIRIDAYTSFAVRNEWREIERLTSMLDDAGNATEFDLLWRALASIHLEQHDLAFALVDRALGSNYMLEVILLEREIPLLVSIISEDYWDAKQLCRSLTYHWRENLVAREILSRVSAKIGEGFSLPN